MDIGTEYIIDILISHVVYFSKEIIRKATKIRNRSPILELPEQIHSVVVVKLVVEVVVAVVVLVVVDATVLEE